MSDVGNALVGRPVQNPATRFGNPAAQPNPILGTRQMPNALQLPPAQAPPPALEPAQLPAAPAALPPAPTAAPTPGLADRVSTRIPSAKGQGFDPHTRSDLTVSHESMKPDYDDPKTPDGHSKAYHGTIDRMRKMYPHINMANMSNDGAAEAFTKHVHDNLLYLWGAARNKPWFNEAKDWYHGANKYAENLGKEHGVSTRQAAGVIATLSPQTDWNVNVNRAERALRILKDEKGTPFDAAMRQFTQTHAVDNQKVDKLKAWRQAKLDAIPEGAKLHELKDPWHKAFFVRAHDELMNPDRTYPIYAPNGERSSSGNRMNWSSYPELTNAMKAASSNHLPDISEALGRNHKVRNFYNNIVSPDARHGDITIDTHAINAGQLMPMVAKHVYVQHGLGIGMPETNVTGAHGLYGLYADAYRRAAHTIGRMEKREVLPREVQSATWEATKGLFNNAGFKKHDAEGEPVHEVGKVAKYFQTLARHHVGVDGGSLMTPPMARAALHRAAGGISDPEWWQARQERLRGAA